jgi:hypothetical protein
MRPARCCSHKEVVMYAVVRRYEGVSNPREVGRLVEEAYLPLVSTIPGFVSFDWLEAGGGVVLSTSVFQDEAGVEESNRRAATLVHERLTSLLPNPPQITAGEVTVHKAN